MTHFPEHMSAVEQRIVNKLITAILKRDLSVSVFGEGTLDLTKSKDRAAIQAETAATGLTEYFIHRGPDRVGWFMLVHGNDEEVLSNMTANDLCGEITREAEG